MKIGILGSGDVGKALAGGFMKHGYEVMVGTGNQQKLSEWKSKNKAKTGSFSEAASFGEIIVLAVKGTAAKDALKAAGNINGKTVFDTTNPIADAPPENGVLKFFTSLDNSLMEELQKAFPDVHFVKAFNSIGHAFMVNPDFGGAKPTMCICGNDEDAKKNVSKILLQFGF